MNKTNYIPHSQIVAIYPSYYEGTARVRIRVNGEEDYYSLYGFTTDNNGIHGEFYKEE